ncbi:hypothetical protein HJC23_011468 [Cyclotella cryptica]|uniref:Uncharacterized protein n=1 Tax=Cyclotella cryptica TaxID=29204 RepID=A0ABD3NT68_9STRA|eukprot:CCRYP_019894-RB/>CCRYP_019894-RB protein AED:0.22 eAED:0.22 QI:299/1/1/1/0.5/0.33/3/481/591
MVAQVTDSDDSATMPFVTVAAPSPVVTPSREEGSTKKSGSARTRRKRLSPEESHASSASVSHELFGDFMSIEEIAAQTEKAYQSRKLNAPHKTPPKIPCPSSPSRMLIPGSPKRSRVKKAVSTNKLPSTKKTYMRVVLAAALPFLLCESLLLVLTLRYRDEPVSEMNSLAVHEESLRHLKLDTMERIETDDLVGLTRVGDNYAEQNGAVVNNNGEVSVMNYETSNANDEALITNQSTSSDCGGIKCNINDGHEHKTDEPADGVSKHTPLEGETIQRMNETHKYAILDYEAMLDEAFRLMAASKSTSGYEKETENLLSAETLCNNVLSRVSEASSLSTDQYMDVGVFNKTSEAGARNSSFNAHSLKLLEFNSHLCIGGVKMSTTSHEVDSMLQEAKNAFEYVARLYPYSLGAQAGLGTALLAQVLLNANYPSDSSSIETQVSLLTLATFHLKSASSLCSAPHGLGGRVVDELHISSVVPVEGISIKTEDIGRGKELRHSTHAAVLHNLALAYIALGDSHSSVSLLLRAAAIQRQVEPQRNALYWNLPDKILLLMEEKARLLGAKSEGNKQNKKRRIPFVPETFTFDEMLDGI